MARECENVTVVVFVKESVNSMVKECDGVGVGGGVCVIVSSSVGDWDAVRLSVLVSLRVKVFEYEWLSIAENEADIDPVADGVPNVVEIVTDSDAVLDNVVDIVTACVRVCCD